MTVDSRSSAWRRFFTATIGSLAAMVPSVVAADGTPMPEYTGERVYVKDVPDTFQTLPKAIRELEKGSPQSYFVVVIRSAGAQGATDYVDELFNVWSSQARSKNLKLDPERSVVTLVAVEDRRAAVHVGTLLRTRFGLDRATVQGFVNQVFAPLARDQKYSEAAASLLAAINNTLAKTDEQTATVKTGTDLFPAVQAPASSRAVQPVTPGQTSEPVRPRQAAPAGRDLMWALLASLLAVALIAGFLVWLARRRKRSAVEAKIKEYKKKSVEVMDHLDSLKARLKSLPLMDPDFKEPMSGETLTLYEQAEKKLTGLWDRWLEVMEVLDKAQVLAKKDSALGTEKLKEADSLVSDAKVFEQIEEQSKGVAASMDRLNKAHETARSAADKVIERQKEIHTGIEKVNKEGLPTVPYTPEIDGIATQAEQAKQVLTPDPIGANQTLEAAQQRAVALRDRVGQILERFAEGRTLGTELTALGAKVAEHRRQGLRLDEDGGNPDYPSAQTFQRLEALRRAVHEGDPETALKQLNEAQGFFRQAQQTLDDVLTARDRCAKDHPERVRETRRLQEAMTQYEAFEAELTRDFAASSWQNVAGNLAQARALLQTFDGKTDEAAAAATPDAQKYLLGARLLGQVSQEQQAVFQLMARLADQLNGLKALREECQTAVRGLAEHEQVTEQYVSRNEQAVGAAARGTLQSAQQSRHELEGLLRERKADWPGIRQVLARTLGQYDSARDQAEADVQMYQQLASEFERARQEAGRVRAFLAGREEDRLAANQHCQNAEHVLNRVQSETGGAGGEWAKLLEMVRGAAADLSRSEQLAREDIRLARQAESEIDEAIRTIRKARAYFSMGVTLGTREADAAVNEAQRLYQSQDYEQAIRAAAAAIQQVRQAQAIASQQVYMRQMQMEASRRRQMAGPMAGGMLAGGLATAASAPSRAAAPGPDDGGTGNAGGSAEPSTAAGSWSSETAEGSW
jgi:uncharacterized membrane protein YgcG